MKMGVAVAQITNFQGVDIAPDLRFAQQQTRYRDERRTLLGDAFRIIQLGNSAGEEPPSRLDYSQSRWPHGLLGSTTAGPGATE